MVPDTILPPQRAGNKDTLDGEKRACQSERETRSAANRLEVWGLSGWFLNKLAWRVGWMERPAPLEEPDD
jgi:hypothetical protein